MRKRRDEQAAEEREKVNRRHAVRDATGRFTQLPPGFEEAPPSPYRRSGTCQDCGETFADSVSFNFHFLVQTRWPSHEAAYRYIPGFRVEGSTAVRLRRVFCCDPRDFHSEDDGQPMYRLTDRGWQLVV